MKQDIDFLPKSTARNLDTAMMVRLTGLFAGLLGAIAILLGLKVSYQGGAISSLESKIKAESASLASPLPESTTQLQAQLKALEQEIQSMGVIQQWFESMDQSSFSGVFESLSSGHQSFIRILNLTMSNDQEKIQIEGIARTPADVVQWLDHLRATKSFQGKTLVTLAMEQEGKHVRFIVGGQL